MSFNKWRDTQTVAHPHIRLLFRDKKKWALMPWKDIEENLNAHFNGKKSVWKGDTLYKSNYMTIWKRSNYGDSKKVNGGQGLGGGGEGWTGGT